MNHWPFILAAYGLTALATAVLSLASLIAMRRAERAVAEQVREP